MSQTGLMIYLMTGDIMMAMLMSQGGTSNNMFMMLYLMGYFGKPSTGGVTATPTGAGAVAGTAVSSLLPLLLLSGKKKRYSRRRYRRGGGFISGFVKGLSAGRN